ncbi:type IV secretion system protein VirB5 [Rhizobium mongolense]|uniref:Type IV secretion system protein VirB5 n=2 Tax=Rhizobium mongolense TaxID=57676 RepID=A0ABR6IYM2_9HYPH|nr:type IV secretion system protein VirB5 [Rhizobium mongolense]MBB4232997.1 type IV secretion system protein VirB5 [Rhizobium mongolense]TVZ74739.1 type IV secretion system protein VirB5 [Rhizobium mongolense USDA 1844]
MKFSKLTVTAVATFLVLQGPARAQGMPVIDAAGIAQAIVQIEKSVAILDQTIQLVTMFTSSFGVTSLLSSLNQPNRYPSTTQLGNQMFDSQAPGSTTARAIALDADRRIIGSDAEAALLRQQIAGAANAAGVAAGNLEMMDKRLRENGNTLGELSRSRNIMQATVTNGLLLKQIHDAIIQNSQATSLLTMATAQAGLHVAEEAAAQRRERQKTATIFAIPRLP